MAKRKSSIQIQAEIERANNLIQVKKSQISKLQTRVNTLIRAEEKARTREIIATSGITLTIADVKSQINTAGFQTYVDVFVKTTEGLEYCTINKRLRKGQKIKVTPQFYSQLKANNEQKEARIEYLNTTHTCKHCGCTTMEPSFDSIRCAKCNEDTARYNTTTKKYEEI